MRAAWISLNLIGLTLIVIGAIYTPHNRQIGLAVMFLGFLCNGISNIIKSRVFKNR